MQHGAGTTVTPITGAACEGQRREDDLEAVPPNDDADLSSVSATARSLSLTIGDEQGQERSRNQENGR